MNLSEAILKVGHFAAPSVPEIRYLASAAQKVRDRWPDVDPPNNEREREALALKLRDKVELNAWDKTRLSFVIAAASAVFDPGRRDRPDLSRTRDFLYAEVGASTSETFLSGMLRTYLESYVSNGDHTIALSTELRAATLRMGAAGRLLLDGVPELMDPKTGPDQLASRMSKMSDPYIELIRLGLRNPHSAGFMDLAHLSLTEKVRPHLSEQNLIDWYIRWLRPPGKEEARNAGAERAIEALIHPWVDTSPEDKLRSYLVETMIELYGDPRIKSGGAWSGIDERYLSVIHRWLTREDMRFFTGVVDATQSDAMWPPRRDFWLKLYDEGRIDAAWAALSSQAFDYARQHLMRQDAKNAYTRVGFQSGRSSSNTSLLILKIGNKIMVDGCHNYRTHVFDIADPMAPKLFEEGYDCDDIMRASPAAKPHGSASNGMEPWRRWVRDMINADVPRSQRSRPYAKVYRPRPPQLRNAPLPRQIAAAQPSRRPVSGWFGQAETRGDPGRIKAHQPANTTAVQRILTNTPAQPSTTVDPNRSLKNTHFPNLVDRMLAYGPEAASAVLTFFEGPAAKRTGASLSSRSREGLAWVLIERAKPSLQLRNALEHLLVNLKKSGVDLDDLFLGKLGSAGSGPLFERPNHLPRTTDPLDSETSVERYPPIPETVEGRFQHLLAHVDAIEEIGMAQAKFEQRRSATLAVGKLRDRASDLLPSEVADLIMLYDKLRQRDKEA